MPSAAIHTNGDPICDTGTASTPPLALSSDALMALQRREFRMPRSRVEPFTSG